MADQYTEVTKRGYGSRVGGSFVGILVGLLLIVGSVWVLFSNEGRVDTSRIAATAVEIPSDKTSADGSLDGKLVATIGALSSNQLLGDDQYLKPGRNIVLHRAAEMFSWVEEKSSKSKKEMGGSETTETTYTYNKKWTDKPAESSSFRHPEGHENPALGVESADFQVTEARIGVFDFDPSMIAFPSLTSLPLSAEKLNLPAEVKMVSKRYLFSGRGAINAPQVGDVRIGYFSLPEAAKVTAFGKLAQNSIVPFLDQKGNRLYRMFYGTKDEAVAALRGEYKTTLWVMRLIGFLLLWIGLSMIFEPLSVILDVLPVLGSITRFTVGLITFLASLLISFIIVIVSMIVHNLVALLLVLLAAAGLTYWYLKQKKK